MLFRKKALYFQGFERYFIDEVWPTEPQCPSAADALADLPEAEAFEFTRLITQTLTVIGCTDRWTAILDLLERRPAAPTERGALASIGEALAPTVVE